MTKELTTEAPPSSSVQAPVEAKAPESPFSSLRFTRADLDAAANNVEARARRSTLSKRILGVDADDAAGYAKLFPRGGAR